MAERSALNRYRHSVSSMRADTRKHCLDSPTHISSYPGRQRCEKQPSRLECLRILLDWPAARIACEGKSDTRAPRQREKLDLCLPNGAVLRPPFQRLVDFCVGLANPSGAPERDRQPVADDW